MRCKKCGCILNNNIDACPSCHTPIYKLKEDNNIIYDQYEQSSVDINQLANNSITENNLNNNQLNNNQNQDINSSNNINDNIDNQKLNNSTQFNTNIVQNQFNNKLVKNKKILLVIFSITLVGVIIGVLLFVFNNKNFNKLNNFFNDIFSNSDSLGAVVPIIDNNGKIVYNIVDQNGKLAFTENKKLIKKCRDIFYVEDDKGSVIIDQNGKNLYTNYKINEEDSKCFAFLNFGYVLYKDNDYVILNGNLEEVDKGNNYSEFYHLYNQRYNMYAVFDNYQRLYVGNKSLEYGTIKKDFIYDEFVEIEDKKVIHIDQNGKIDFEIALDEFGIGSFGVFDYFRDYEHYAIRATDDRLGMIIYNKNKKRITENNGFNDADTYYYNKDYIAIKHNLTNNTNNYNDYEIRLYYNDKLIDTLPNDYDLIKRIAPKEGIILKNKITNKYVVIDKNGNKSELNTTTENTKVYYNNFVEIYNDKEMCYAISSESGKPLLLLDDAIKCQMIMHSNYLIAFKDDKIYVYNGSELLNEFTSSFTIEEIKQLDFSISRDKKVLYALNVNNKSYLINIETGNIIIIDDFADSAYSKQFVSDSIFASVENTNPNFDRNIYKYNLYNGNGKKIYSGTYEYIDIIEDNYTE